MRLKLLRQLSFLLIFPAACSAPGKVLTAHGPSVKESDGSDSQYRRFADLWGRAMDLASAKPDSPDSRASNAALLSGGFSLVYNDCSDFFRQRGVLQQRLSFVRDTTGAIVPVVTGALGLVSGAGNAVAALGLAGGAVNSGIGVVAQDFLFGADNIDDVRVLTLNALSSHQNKVTALARSNRPAATFDWTANQIMDDQSICEGPEILTLAKQAIAKGNVKAYASATTPAKPAGPGKRAAGSRRSAATTTEEFVAPETSKFLAVEGATPSLPTRVGVRIEN